MSEVSGVSEEACVYRLLMRHGRAGALRAFTSMKEIESWPDQSVLIAIELLIAKGAQMVEDPLDTDNTLAWAQARFQHTNQPNKAGSRLLEVLLQHSNKNDPQLQGGPTPGNNITNAWGDSPAEDVLSVMKHVLKYDKLEQRQIVLHHPFNATALLAAAASAGRSERNTALWALAVGAGANGIDLRTIRSARTRRQSSSDSIQQHTPTAATQPNTAGTVDGNSSSQEQEVLAVGRSKSATAAHASQQRPCNGHEGTKQYAEEAASQQDQHKLLHAHQACNGQHPDAGPQPFNCQCHESSINQVEHHCQPDDDSSDAEALLAMGADIDHKLCTDDGCSNLQPCSLPCAEVGLSEQTHMGLHSKPCNTNGDVSRLTSGPTVKANAHQNTAAYLQNSSAVLNGHMACDNDLTGKVSELTASSVFAKQYSSQRLGHVDTNGSHSTAQITEQTGLSQEVSSVEHTQPKAALQSDNDAAMPTCSNEINTEQHSRSETDEHSLSNNAKMTEEELRQETEKWVISPLAEAAAAGDSYIVELLIMVHEADPGAYGGLAERMATKHGHHQLAKFIYEQVLERQAAKRGFKNKPADTASAKDSITQGPVAMPAPSYQYVTLGDWVKSVMPTWSGLKRAIVGRPQPRSRVRNTRITHGKQAPVTYHSSNMPPNNSHKTTSKRTLLYGLAAIATAGAAGYFMYRFNSTKHNPDNSSNSVATEASISQ